MKRRRKSLAVAINPLVVDLSHHNDIADFGAVKATRALGVGLLWGAYHFLRPGDFFLKPRFAN
jgi:hypothetical protein